MITIRKEAPQDVVTVRRINELAFEGTVEADIVDALRGAAQPQLSLVAEYAGGVIGHIFFSPVTIRSADSVFDAIGLAPMAVLPEFQRRGIGTELVERGLDECRRLGHPVVVVVGHPDFYPRFGFSPAREKGLEYAEEVPDEAFMVAELVPGALRGVSGVVSYRPEFDGA
jgi:putative acetyltransferase